MSPPRSRGADGSGRCLQSRDCLSSGNEHIDTRVKSHLRGSRENEVLCNGPARSTAKVLPTNGSCGGPGSCLKVSFSRGGGRRGFCASAMKYGSKGSSRAHTRATAAAPALPSEMICQSSMILPCAEVNEHSKEKKLSKDRKLYMTTEEIWRGYVLT